MKDLEKAYRTYLPKKSYAVLRVDGKGFSKYTSKLNKPFDYWFTECMRETALYLAENVDGAVLAYTQSDEISVVFSDLGGANTEWWFGGQVQKLVSVTAAMATAKFNSLRDDDGLAVFDARVHPLNGTENVLGYLKWRQTDAIKNSVSMLASHHFSHKELDCLSTYGRIRKLDGIGVNWNHLSSAIRQGSWVHKEAREKSVTFTYNGEEQTVDFVRNEWVVDNAPKFETVRGLGLEKVDAC